MVKSTVSKIDTVYKYCENIAQRKSYKREK